MYLEKDAMNSVCMATYNGAKYIKEQINSILLQLGENDEIVVSDDGSTDGTLNILSSYNDPRIIIVHHDCNKEGLNPSELVGKNFENAIQHARGEFIFISDQDDLWFSDKIAVLSDALKRHSVVCSDGNIFINDDINKIVRTIYENRRPQQNYILRVGKYLGCCLAFRRDMLQYILPFPSRMPLYDHWIGLIAELMGSSVFIERPLIYHRIHTTNTSENTNFSIWYKIFYRVRFLIQLYARVLKFKLLIFLKKHYY